MVDTKASRLFAYVAYIWFPLRTDPSSTFIGLISRIHINLDRLWSLWCNSKHDHSGESIGAYPVLNHLTPPQPTAGTHSPPYTMVQSAFSTGRVVRVVQASAAPLAGGLGEPVGPLLLPHMDQAPVVIAPCPAEPHMGLRRLRPGEEGGAAATVRVEVFRVECGRSGRTSL